ncbi:MAG: drug/metabolite exporter YedA [Acidobacteria bacterium]|nr:drug/metabolite exporter YedA [Acidobacteriota bacterium]
MTDPHSARSPSRAGVLAAFGAVYVIWGSTYLAIRFGIETLPPFLMVGARYLGAGVLMYAWARARGTSRPTPRNWAAAAVIGGLMLLGGNGLVTWSEKTVPSGLAALLVATVPLWMVLLDWARPRGERPAARVFVALALGLAGIAILLGPGELLGARDLPWAGALAVVLASFSWAAGSLYSRAAPLPSEPMLATGMEMLAGGALATLVGLALGEGARFDAAAISTRSALALGYLIVFGSLVAFTAYVWLLRVTTPARVATYAYVNPLVAVLLGWALAGEPLGPRTVLAAAVIIAAVVLITTAQAVRARPPVAEVEPQPETERERPRLLRKTS